MANIYDENGNYKGKIVSNSEGTWVLERHIEKDTEGVERYATYKMNTNNGDVYLLFDGMWKKIKHWEDYFEEIKD